LANPTIIIDAVIIDKAMEGEIRFKNMILTDKLWNCAQSCIKQARNAGKKVILENRVIGQKVVE